LNRANEIKAGTLFTRKIIHHPFAANIRTVNKFFFEKVEKIAFCSRLDEVLKLLYKKSFCPSGSNACPPFNYQLVWRRIHDRRSV